MALWAASAAAFALSRVPYDDEWFSITLVRDTTWPQMWRSLAHDVHPPWLAVADRALYALTRSLAALTALRVASSTIAIALLVAAAPRLGVRKWALALGAFHPIVLMYGGALRWYPIALLADALRLWALTRDPSVARERRGGELAFVAGAALGVAAGYAECVLVALDGLAWLWRAARGRALVRAVGVVAIAAWIPVASLVSWPPFFGSLHGAVGGSGAAAGLRGAAGFVTLGVLGEAHPAPPWTLLALFAIPGLALAMASGLRLPEKRPLGFAVLRAAAGWLACAPLGVGHPRYGLLVWVGLSALTLDALADAIRPRASVIVRAALAATAAYLAFALTLTLRQRSFLKRDLNVLDPAACSAVFGLPADVVFVPYPGLAAKLSRICAPFAPVVTAGSVRHYEPGDDAQFADALAVLPHAHTVTLATVPETHSSLEWTQRRARALIAARCREIGAQDVLEDRWARAKALGREGATTSAFCLHVARFACP